MNTVQHDFLTLIQTRRSVRAYKPDPVPADLLDAVLEAGTWAPTGGGRQSPTIVAVTDPAARRQIAALNARVMGSDTDPYYGAPAVVLVLADGPPAPLWRTAAACWKTSCWPPTLWAWHRLGAPGAGDF